MRIAFFVAAITTAAVATASACSSSETNNGGGTSSGTTPPPQPPPAPLNPPPPPGPNPPQPPPTDGGSDVDAAAQCNTVVQQGAPVEVLVAAPPAPAPAGGTVVDGTYVLTAATHYTAAKTPGTSEGFQQAQTLDLTGGVIKQISDLDGSAPRRENDPYTVADGGLSLTQTCKNPPPAIDGGFTFPYTATSTSLTIYFTTNLTNAQVLTYTKK